MPLTAWPRGPRQITYLTPFWQISQSSRPRVQLHLTRIWRRYDIKPTSLLTVACRPPARLYILSVTADHEIRWAIQPRDVTEQVT